MAELGADQLDAGGGLNTVRNAAASRASSETSSCSRSGGNMSSVRIRYSADWKAGMWPGATPTATTVPLPAVDYSGVGLLFSA